MRIRLSIRASLTLLGRISFPLFRRMFSTPRPESIAKRLSCRVINRQAECQAAIEFCFQGTYGKLRQYLGLEKCPLHSQMITIMKVSQWLLVILRAGLLETRCASLALANSAILRALTAGSHVTIYGRVGRGRVGPTAWRREYAS